MFRSNIASGVLPATRYSQIIIIYIYFLSKYLIPLQQGRHATMPRKETRRKEQRRNGKFSWKEGGKVKVGKVESCSKINDRNGRFVRKEDEVRKI